MNEIFGNDFRNISYINRLKIGIFSTVVIICILLNFFLSLSLNFKKISKDSLFKVYIIADLQHNLNDSKKYDIEKFILSTNGVASTRFMDKKESFKNLQKELNIFIPESSNPLSDSIIVTLKDFSYVDKVQEILENEEDIREVYKDDAFFKNLVNKKLVYSLVELITAIITLILIFTLIILFKLNVSIDFLNSVNINKKYKDIIRICKIRNLLSFSSATILGTLIFFNIYIYFRKYTFIPHFKYPILSLWQLLIWHIPILVFLNFIIWILPASISKIDGGQNE